MRVLKLFFGLVCAIGVARSPSLLGKESVAFLRDEIDAGSEFMISSWRAGEGLPASEIEDLQETPDGYLWMGTLQGLVRFDGVRFDTFFNTPTGLRYGARIGPLETDSRGQLWLVPDEVGIIRRDTNSFSEVLTNGTVLKGRVVNLCSDGQSNLMWVDINGDLGKFSIEQPENAERIKGGGATAGSEWVRDFAGKMWLANSRSLKIYEGKWRDVAVPGSGTMTVTARRAGGLWVAREAKLRFVTADGKHRETAPFPWAGQSRVTCLLEDSRQRLWIGTIGQGLWCYADGKFTQVAPTASSILCLLEDKHGSLWVGTRGRGLVRIRSRQFFMCNQSSGLTNEFVRSLAEDKAGRIWMLTEQGGLGYWQNGAWRQLEQTNGWPKHDSLCVLPTSDGSVLVSTSRRELWRWSNDSFKKVEFGFKFPREPATDMLEDRQKRLWMVTDNLGIFCVETNKLTAYSMRQGLPSVYMRRIIEDEAGEIWAGDWEGGIARLRGKHWELVRKSSGHRDAVRSMVSVEGALWIGTSAGGLLRLKNGETSRISVDEGLPSTCIQQLLSDGNGSLWGGTPHRLFRISLKQLNEVADGRRKKIEAITYGRSDGLPDVSFADWSDPRCCRTTEGELWFATASGAIHFRPENLQESKPPQVLLEQTLFDDKPATAAALQHLRPGPGRLEFRFTAPCLTAPDRVRFRYQLTGIDSDWVNAGTERTVTYANLPAGDHVFRVMASSPEGAWSLQPATIALSVHPFFWQTNWFLAAIAGAIAGGAVWILRRATVLRLRRRLEILRQQHAMDRERTRIAQDIHDELGANLTSIGLLADMGMRHKMDSFMVAGELRQISETARESVTAMDSIVWALNPRNDSLDHFANYVSQFTRDFFRPTKLRTRLDLPTNLPMHPMSTETRHQLFLIVKESFNNIVRHAQASEVNLEMGCENGHLRLMISDDGKGLSHEPAGEGHNGLTNLRERIERLGGTLQIQSQNGQGTKLEFNLPVEKFKSN